MFERIKDIVEEVIGSPRRETEGWTDYCCPYCALEKGVESDGKYNLAVNYGEDMKTKSFFHCWRCGTSGKLAKLLKDFGGDNYVKRYNKELSDIYNSALYCLDFKPEEEILQINAVDLPQDFRKIKMDDKYAKEAIEYLKKRYSSISNVSWIDMVLFATDTASNYKVSSPINIKEYENDALDTIRHIMSYAKMKNIDKEIYRDRKVYVKYGSKILP